MNAFVRAAAPLVALALGGCVATSPNWEARFGEAARVTTAQQIISPEASQNSDPVAGVDGKAASEAMRSYAKSFSQPEPQPALLTIDMGGGK